MRKKGDSARRVLRTEHDQELRTQKQAVDAENQFFADAQSTEIQRHSAVMLQYQQAHISRMNDIKEQDQKYAAALMELKRNYATKKRRLNQQYQHQVRMIEDARHMDSDESLTVGEENVLEPEIAEAIAQEVMRLLGSRKPPIQKKNQKLRMLTNEMESYIQLVQARLNRRTE